MTDWPASLPQAFLIDGYEESEPDTAIWSQPEVGARIGRRRSTYGVMPFSGDMMLSVAQKVTLKHFWRDTLASGTGEFELPAQDGSEDIWTCRIPTPPRFRPVSGTDWRVSLVMEVMPAGVRLGASSTIGSASGRGVAFGVTVGRSVATGTAAGVGTATAIVGGTTVSAGTAAGVGAATAVAETLGGDIAAGMAAGAGSASGVARAIVSGAGAASGVGAATGATTATFTIDGSAAGTGTATAVAERLGVGGTAAGMAAGVGSATGVTALATPNAVEDQESDALLDQDGNPILGQGTGTVSIVFDSAVYEDGVYE